MSKRLPILIMLVRSFALLVCFCILGSFPVFAQSIKLGALANAGTSDRGFSEVSAVVYGLEIFGMYEISPILGARLNTGYFAFPNNISTSEGEPEVKGAIISIPITAGLEVHAKETEEVQPYVGIDAGYFFLDATGDLSFGSDDSLFGLSPHFGIRIKLTDVLSLDLGARYNALYSSDNDRKGPELDYYSARVGLVMGL